MGAGSYGEVAKAIDISSGEEVAIKRFFNIFKDVTHAKRVVREVCLMR